jgi:hypothetical protein
MLGHISLTPKLASKKKRLLMIKRRKHLMQPLDQTHIEVIQMKNVRLSNQTLWIHLISGMPLLIHRSIGSEKA